MNRNTRWMLGIALLIGAAAGTTLYIMFEKRNKKALPPKNAPQLELDNPGTQAEFPTSASDSELG